MDIDRVLKVTLRVFFTMIEDRFLSRVWLLVRCQSFDAHFQVASNLSGHDSLGVKRSREFNE